MPIESVPLAGVKTNAPEEVLALIWHQMLIERQIDGAKLVQLVGAYVDRQAPEMSRAVMFQNLQRELAQPTMTWKVFTKGLFILGVSAASFVVGTETTEDVMAPVRVDLNLDPNRLTFELD